MDQSKSAGDWIENQTKWNKNERCHASIDSIQSFGKEAGGMVRISSENTWESKEGTADIWHQPVLNIIRNLPSDLANSISRILNIKCLECVCVRKNEKEGGRGGERGRGAYSWRASRNLSCSSSVQLSRDLVIVYGFLTFFPELSADGVAVDVAMGCEFDDGELEFIEVATVATGAGGASAYFACSAR